jgi:DNA-binding beta-propeller fold protein YncE
MKHGLIGIVVTIQAVLFFILFSSAGASAQNRTVIWSKTDADPYTHVAFSHDGRILALGRSDSNTSDFLNVLDGSLIRTFGGPHNENNDMVFTLDDRYLVTGCNSSGSVRSISLWSVADAHRLFLLGDHTNGTHNISMSPDGRFVVSGGRNDGEINVWHIPDMVKVSSFGDSNPSGGGYRHIKDVAYSRDGTFVADSDASGIDFFDPFSGALLLSIPVGMEAYSIAISPDGTLIAGAFAGDRTVKIFRTSDGSLVRTLTIESPAFDFPQVAFSPNGEVIVAGYNTGWDAGALKFWRVSDGEVLSFEQKSGAIISLAFAPKGNRFAYTQFDGQIVMATAPKLGSR